MCPEMTAEVLIMSTSKEYEVKSWLHDGVG